VRHVGPKWISLTVRQTVNGSRPLADAGTADEGADDVACAEAGRINAPARPLPRTPMAPPATSTLALRDKSLMLPPSFIGPERRYLLCR